MIIIVFLFYFDRFLPSHCKTDQQCLLSSFKETIIKGLAQEISKPCFNVSSLTKQREEIFESRNDSNNKINVMVVDFIKNIKMIKVTTKLEHIIQMNLLPRIIHSKMHKIIVN